MRRLTHVASETAQDPCRQRAPMPQQPSPESPEDALDALFDIDDATDSELEESEDIASNLKTSEELQLEKEPIRVRETGFWLWRQIIVPPNTYVIHTRMNRKEPITLGLGLSFRYRPFIDAYLVVPAAMQTIGVVANCISKEKQGLNILAYVQWQIDDFAQAYRKLDFSDSRDPLAIVNAQLREQAEAAIKDKIATMSVEEVLTDKAPIIEELTTRLKTVTEGSGADGKGLGIKIVTVQIREALVSSERLWQHLQASFRHEQEKQARISRLVTQDEIRQKELQTRQHVETREAETMAAIERIKQSKQTEATEIRLSEEANRFTKEQETARERVELEERLTAAKQESEQRLTTQALNLEQERKLQSLQISHEHQAEQLQLSAKTDDVQKTLEIKRGLHILAEDNRLHESHIQTEQARLERETVLKEQEAAFKLLRQQQEGELQAQVLAANLEQQRQKRTAQLELQTETDRVELARQEQEALLERMRQETRNLINERDLLREFIAKLPELASEMPEVHELKVLQTGGGDTSFDQVSAFLTKMIALAENMGLRLPLQVDRGN